MKAFKNHFVALALGLGVTVLGALTVIAVSNSKDRSFAQNAPGDILSLLTKQYPMENPDLAINKAGDMVIVWQERKAMDYEVFAMKGKADNTSSFSAPVQVNNYKQGNQTRPRVAMNEKGQFVVVWESAGQDRSGSGVYGQRFTAKLKKNGPEIQVHKTTLNNQGFPDVTMNETGAFTVVWTGETETNQTRRVYLQRFNDKVKKEGNETKVDQISLSSASSLGNPRIAALGTGEMIVVWETMVNAGLIDVAAQVFDAAGAPKTSADIVLNAASEGKNFNPNVIGFDEDEFLVSWEKDLRASEFKNLELSYENIKGRKIKTDGSMSDEADYSPAKNINSNNTPELVATGNGAVVVWQERKKEGDSRGAKQRWFMQAQEIDSEGKSVGDPMTLINGRETPYNGTRMSSNGNAMVGILWSEKEGSAKSKIQFRPWTLQITAKEAEELHTAAPEEGVTTGN